MVTMANWQWGELTVNRIYLRDSISAHESSLVSEFSHNRITPSHQDDQPWQSIDDKVTRDNKKTRNYTISQNTFIYKNK